ncbi:hypothetical protein LMG7974_00310 [Campylobacter majalis]|uniref:YihY family inner membrane protein n=1 Tax=Campylobacter majalis TaxID=2790656 RepID=A0ABM8Q3H0_9BACT|nr:YihY family inner membrane protein [Campylobacter majalis]CAD7287431.1 hypothetical protein LMG7974_00310 [Campylobacter majalis]
MKEKCKKYIKILKDIKDNNINMYASSLSFHTIMSIIPLLLITLSLFTQMPVFTEYYSKIEEFIFNSMLPTHQDVMSKYLQNFMKNSVNLGIMGFVAVVFTSTMFFTQYERIILKITKAKKRSLWSLVSSYWTLLTLAPMGLALSFYLSNLIQNLLNSNQYTSGLNFLSVFPYLVIWIMFCVVYLISVSEPMRFKNALIGSFVGSLVWYLGKSAFVYYAMSNKTYSSIYGSFSVMLFFILWVYVSWIIFLYGLKIASYLEQKQKCQNANKQNSNA